MALNFKKRRLLILVILILSLASLFTFFTITDINSIKAMNAKKLFISSLLSEAGYGGFIHNFKNYVLRQDETYYHKASQQLDRLIALLQNEIQAIENNTERESLNNILRTFSEYRYKLDLGKRYIDAEDISPTDLDQWVKVSDIDAIDAQKKLLLVIQASIDQQLQRTLTKTLIFIFVLFLAVVLILYLYFVEIKQLEHQDNFLTLILNHIPDYIFVKDKNYRITFANDNFINLYPQYMHNKIIGHTTLEEYKKEDADIFLTMDKLAFDEGMSQAIEKLTLPDGKIRTLDTTKIRFEGQDQELFILGISRDISKLQMTIEKLELVNEELTQFAYRTSHDLKAPITTISGLAHFIKMDIADKEYDEAMANLDKISVESHKLLNLITDILNLTRADRSFSETYESVYLHALVNELSEKHQALISAKEVTIQNHIDPSLSLISVKIRIYQIMENLLTNGVKYCDPQKQERHVRIESCKKSGAVEITVQDNGLGIPESAADKIFNLFTRYHPEAAEGSGMGLAILKKHVDRLDASIRLECQPDGSKFIITIPQQDHQS